MDILEIQYHRREFDGKIEKLGRVPDLDNAYSYVNDAGSRITLIPEKWIILDVLNNGPLTPERVAGEA